jgi:hypothetical protein
LVAKHERLTIAVPDAVLRAAKAGEVDLRLAVGRDDELIVVPSVRPAVVAEKLLRALPLSVGSSFVQEIDAMRAKYNARVADGDFRAAERVVIRWYLWTAARLAFAVGTSVYGLSKLVH